MNATKYIIGIICVLLISSCLHQEKNSNVQDASSNIENQNWLEAKIMEQLSRTNTQDSIELYALPIEDIPEQIYNYPNISYLRIDCTSTDCMKTLSGRIKEFKNLETLIISKSALKELPQEIGELPNMKILRILGGGKLLSVPKELLRLEKLEVLDLWRNSLIELPIDLYKMRSLKSINLGENKFSVTFLSTITAKYPQIEIKYHR